MKGSKLIGEDGIRTAGDLRRVLANVIVGLNDGTVSPEVAMRTVKTAAQITESFYCETKIRLTSKSLGEAVPMLGTTPLYIVAKNAVAQTKGSGE